MIHVAKKIQNNTFDKEHIDDHHNSGHKHDNGYHCHHHHDNIVQDDEIINTDKNTRVWHIEGMDCAACAAKITSTVRRLKGVKDVHVSLARTRLTLNVDETLFDSHQIEKMVASLGYKLHKMDPQKNEGFVADKKWYQTGKGKNAILSGLFLIVAYISSFFFPTYSFWFFTLAAIISLIPITYHALTALWNKSPFTIETLMTIAAIGALFINAAQEAAVVVFLFCIGELLEGVATNRARMGIQALGALAPKKAWRENNGQLSEISANDLKIGDIILVRPGDRIAGDGIIIDGTSSVDESPVTGESIPIIKTINDTVFAGSINSDATLRIRVETKASDNTIARIIALVEEAQDAKAPTQRFIDSFSKIYMPIIVGMAILIGVIPPLVDGMWMQWTYRALTLLLIGCPCALVISVPAAIASSLSAGTRNGLLVKGGNVIETLAKINCITFDKTGTLTKGQPIVTDIVAKTMDENTLLRLSVALERESSHPLAIAITNEAKNRKIDPLTVSNVRAIAGKGIQATWKDQSIFIGAPRFCLEYGKIDEKLEYIIEQKELEGKTVIVILYKGNAIGIIALRDEPRDDAIEAINTLKKIGIESIMLTGDNQRTGSIIAEKLNMKVKAELMPEMKAVTVKDLSKDNIVAMVGDGINDAPALAAANVGIAMGSGTDVALETADAAILRNRVVDIALLIKLSRATMRNIRQNVTLALGLKFIFLLTTIFGMTGLWIAIMADTGATVLVTLNALRLLSFKK
ncbi:heavy metal translocating P-type ATPase [Bartonella tamiae]|uniref:P-type Zn(2+) transporter n=1 Tax=Bartonella tamiae Th239 TaxID=1094558 RepID=J1K098_9HYPH|nr:heavy metal translocating P-type ATPase [Bartonella tamiae]EJF90405.1 heavy metal translocating P-type ATPase [Bartonella tamiae Th239]EJF93651.1 heavy metal translocating P-type ATPase [Bartonella tamiae Th307]